MASLQATVRTLEAETKTLRDLLEQTRSTLATDTVPTMNELTRKNAELSQRSEALSAELLNTQTIAQTRMGLLEAEIQHLRGDVGAGRTGAPGLQRDREPREPFSKRLMESMAIGRMDKLGAGDEKQGGRVYQIWNEKFQNIIGGLRRGARDVLEWAALRVDSVIE